MIRNVDLKCWNHIGYGACRILRRCEGDGADHRVEADDLDDAAKSVQEVMDTDPADMGFEAAVEDLYDRYWPWLLEV